MNKKLSLQIQQILILGILLYVLANICYVFIEGFNGDNNNNNNNDNGEANDPKTAAEKKKEREDAKARIQEKRSMKREDIRRKLIEKRERRRTLGKICGGTLNLPCERHDLFCNTATPLLRRGDDSFGGFISGKGICMRKPVCKDGSQKGTPKYIKECVNDLKLQVE